MSGRLSSWKRWRLVSVLLMQLSWAGLPASAWAVQQEEEDEYAPIDYNVPDPDGLFEDEPPEKKPSEEKPTEEKPPEEPPAEPEIPEPEPSVVNTDLSYLVQIVGAYWFNDLDTRAHHFWLELEYRPRLVIDWGEDVRLVTEPLIRSAISSPDLDLGFSYGDEGLDYERNVFSGLPERQTVVFKEAHLGLRTGSLDLTLGWQIFSWGKADAFRPLDVLQATDYTDRFRDERLGIFSLSAAWASDEWLLEGVWAPLPTLDRFATHTNNVWSILPRSPGGGGPSILDKSEFPERRLDAGEGGLRASYFGESLDWTVVYARSLDRSPSRMGLTRIVDDAMAPRFVVRPIFERFHLFGGSIASTLSDYLLRMDAAYVLYDHPREGLVTSGLKLIVGGERRWDLAQGKGTFLATAQYALDTTAAETFAPVVGTLPSPFRVFRHAATASMTVTWREQYTAEVKALVALQPVAWVVRGALRFKLEDGVVAWVGCDVLDASSESAVNSVRKADRILIGLELRAD